VTCGNWIGCDEQYPVHPSTTSRSKGGFARSRPVRSLTYAYLRLARCRIRRPPSHPYSTMRSARIRCRRAETARRSRYSDGIRVTCYTRCRSPAGSLVSLRSHVKAPASAQLQKGPSAVRGRGLGSTACLPTAVARATMTPRCICVAFSQVRNKRTANYSYPRRKKKRASRYVTETVDEAARMKIFQRSCRPGGGRYRDLHQRHEIRERISAKLKASSPAHLSCSTSQGLYRR